MTDSVAETGPGRRPAGSGDPYALLAVRVLAAGALVVSAYLHARTAANIGLGGPVLGLGRLMAGYAVLAGLVAVTLLVRDTWVWWLAVALSLVGLAAIASSVYLPVPPVGLFPGINEPVWLLTKAVCAFAEFSVVVLWLVRQIAPPPARPRPRSYL